MGTAIAGMTFHYKDCQWRMKSFPIHFLSTSDIGKSANNHDESIIRSVLRNNDQIVSDVLIFSGTIASKPSVALDIKQHSNYSGSVRCIFHTFSLDVNEVVPSGDFTDVSLQKLATISSYLNTHKNIRTELMELQCRKYNYD